MAPQAHELLRFTSPVALRPHQKTVTLFDQSYATAEDMRSRMNAFDTLYQFEYKYQDDLLNALDHYQWVLMRIRHQLVKPKSW
jgi:hypothetical protein